MTVHILLSVYQLPGTVLGAFHAFMMMIISSIYTIQCILFYMFINDLFLLLFI